MAVYLGTAKNTSAVRTALKIHWATKHIVQPELTRIYSGTAFVVNHVVGIDTSDLYVARTGVRGDNDLVWVGRAPNWAAKLCSLDHSYPTWITKAVHDNMHTTVMNAKDEANMWEARSWTPRAGATIYRSKHWWPL
jgi:class 3 adenylate cyclase